MDGLLASNTFIITVEYSITFLGWRCAVFTRLVMVFYAW